MVLSVPTEKLLGVVKVANWYVAAGPGWVTQAPCRHIWPPGQGGRSTLHAVPEAGGGAQLPFEQFWPVGHDASETQAPHWASTQPRPLPMLTQSLPVRQTP